MATLDQFINFIIPVALLLIAGLWVGQRFKEPIKDFFSWLNEKFEGKKEEVDLSQGLEIVYQK